MYIQERVYYNYAKFILLVVYASLYHACIFQASPIHQWLQFIKLFFGLPPQIP